MAEDVQVLALRLRVRELGERVVLEGNLDESDGDKQDLLVFEYAPVRDVSDVVFEDDGL